jgi:small subunit ribosomal protein S4
MARYTGPVCKLCRREGEKLFLKGERCFSPKCPFERDRDYPPGEHGRLARFRRRRRPSDYSRQLREKQKARRIYGVLERQFRRYFREAERRAGLTGENLLTLLESRLDNVIYRLGFADSRAQARQLVQHGHFVINGRRTTIPSYLIRSQDTITVRDGSRKRTYFKERAKRLDEGSVPSWLSLDAKTMTARVLKIPARDDIETTLNEQMVVEYYSR